jgi:AraC family transcriptional regulator of adaptative response/methylated-DNA-[protein]-cysteine methyltransferase
MNSTAAYNLFASRPPLSAAPPSVYLAVTSTGIFCRPGCPARMPKRENCVFYDSPEAALAEGFRACKRCHPTRLPGEASDLVKTLIALVESAPEHRWGETDLKTRGIDPSTARRQFQARFGMSFSAYARARRLGRAAQVRGKGESVMEAQLSAGYESPSAFRDAFSKTFGMAPKNAPAAPLSVDWIDTPLGPMICVGDATHVYLVEFTDRVKMDKQFGKLTKRHKRAIVPGKAEAIDRMRAELSAYFKGELTEFTTPLKTSGTDFQNATWDQLRAIPYGQTRSYLELAHMVGSPKGFRAVANSNANNGLAIVIPCHRVIASGGGLGGYAGHLSRKKWLLEHEAKHAR